MFKVYAEENPSGSLTQTGYARSPKDDANEELKPTAKDADDQRAQVGKKVWGEEHWNAKCCTSAMHI
ncbi:hypothetical protein NDU88_010864 [Pleurodeles waltl]|uniref:Uncharacterized protein n=1 Tax=Pleurodeles waltl TaxID=8319 RepID=A0AAV7QZH5_PLEWA|nr:hypothetical protein NDU88_010864 [Pleurodeles waltl]